MQKELQTVTEHSSAAEPEVPDTPKPRQMVPTPISGRVDPGGGDTTAKKLFESEPAEEGRSAEAIKAQKAVAEAKKVAKTEVEAAKAEAEAAKSETELMKREAEAAKAETELMKREAEAAKAETELMKKEIRTTKSEVRLCIDVRTGWGDDRCFTLQ